MDNTPGDKLGVWRDMRLADALVEYFAKSLNVIRNGNVDYGVSKSLLVLVLVLVYN